MSRPASASPSQAATNRQSPVIGILPEFRDRSLAALLVELNLINEAWRQAKDRRYDAEAQPGLCRCAARGASTRTGCCGRTSGPRNSAPASPAPSSSADLARFGFPYTGSRAAGRPEVGALQSASPAGA